MHSFQLSQCTGIHTHLIGSALFSLLAISWNTKEVERLTGTDSIFFFFSGVCGKYLFPFQGNWCCKVLPVTIVPGCCYFFPIKECIKCKPTKQQSQLDTLFLKGAAEIITYLHKSEQTAIIRKQPLDVF